MDQANSHTPMGASDVELKKFAAAVNRHQTIISMPYVVGTYRYWAKIDARCKTYYKKEPCLL